MKLFSQFEKNAHGNLYKIKLPECPLNFVLFCTVKDETETEHEFLIHQQSVYVKCNNFTLHTSFTNDIHCNCFSKRGRYRNRA